MNPWSGLWSAIWAFVLSTLQSYLPDHDIVAWIALRRSSLAWWKFSCRGRRWLGGHWFESAWFGEPEGSESLWTTRFNEASARRKSDDSDGGADHCRYACRGVESMCRIRAHCQRGGGRLGFPGLAARRGGFTSISREPLDNTIAAHFTSCSISTTGPCGEGHYGMCVCLYLQRWWSNETRPTQLRGNRADTPLRWLWWTKQLHLPCAPSTTRQ